MSGREQAYLDYKKLVLGELECTLDAIDPAQIAEMVEYILNSRSIFFVGVGRVLMSLQAMAKRFSHLGIDAHIVGDVTEPAIREGDLLIVGSGSGESLVPVAIAEKAYKLGARVVHIGSNPHGSVSRYASFMLRIPVQTKLALEDEIRSKQPMTSLFEQSLLLVGDIMAGMIVNEKDLELSKLWEYHANLE